MKNGWHAAAIALAESVLVWNLQNHGMFLPVNAFFGRLLQRFAGQSEINPCTDGAHTAQWDWTCFPGSDEQVEMLAQAWPHYDALSMVEVLKPGSVWAVGDIVIKSGSARRLRRSAEAWERLDPIPSPEPLMLGVRGRRGILFMRRCPGVPIGQAWHHKPVRRALSRLVADLMRRRIIHGDLSCENMLWDGRRLWLMDLKGLRSVYHGFFWRHHLVRTWAWIYRRMPDRESVREAHDRCCMALGLHEPDRWWESVLAYEERIRTRLAAQQEKSQPRPRGSARLHQGSARLSAG